MSAVASVYLDSKNGGKFKLALGQNVENLDARSEGLETTDLKCGEIVILAILAFVRRHAQRRRLEQIRDRTIFWQFLVEQPVVLAPYLNE